MIATTEPLHTDKQTATTMAFSMVISSARLNTTEEDIRRVFDKLNLGELDRVDIVNSQSRGVECLKIFIHYATTDPSADRLRVKLEENDFRQKEGEIVPPIKIVYGRTREGRDQYWQVYKCKTPAERVAEQTTKTAKTEEFSVRIEM
jgi:hypothetical protein